MAPAREKIAVGRFMSGDAQAREAYGMLVAQLAGVGEFQVLERPDLTATPDTPVDLGPDLAGVDTLVLGSLTKFDTSKADEAGFWPGHGTRTAQAEVQIQLVDAATGQVYFSATGDGATSSVDRERADNGAIIAAISDVSDILVAKMTEHREQAAKVGAPVSSTPLSPSL